MSATEQYAVSGLLLRIDRTLCVGFGDCIAEAPEAFALDDEGIAVFTDPEAVGRARLIQAAEACPVDAIIVLDGAGRQVAP
ncbi:MAG: ferredoxin [Gemmatimonadales bacterium]|nr:ferredoxin [Gemmatimonadales bacterium]